jgi:hypothetical protein
LDAFAFTEGFKVSANDAASNLLRKVTIQRRVIHKCRFLRVLVVVLVLENTLETEGKRRNEDEDEDEDEKGRCE